MKKLNKVLLYFLPAVLFFSYHPVISLGANEFMNFDLSLPEIWLVLFFVASLPTIRSFFKFYGLKRIALAYAIPMYFLLSSFWSGNVTRTILTTGILGLVIFTVMQLLMMLKEDSKLRGDLIKVLLFSAAFLCVVCWVQCVMDIAGISREYTLLCRGCTYSSFGFPHPNGFAIEPQFMGNLLLVPTLLSFYLLFASAYKNKKQKISLVILTGFLTTTLFITLSRGAIFSFVLGLVVLFVFSCTKKFPLIKYKSKKARFTIAIMVVCMMLALFSEGVFAAFSPTNDDFITGVTKSIHQMTLGVIDIRPTTNLVNDADESTTEEAISGAEDGSTEISSSFSGYVAESTDTRLNLNSLAIDTWVSSPKYFLVGTGIGAAGIAMHEKHPIELGPKEIVQNEYVSLLLETGVLGCLIILAVLIFAVRFIPKNPLFLAILVSFAFSLLFFSGLPNALHVYILPFLFATKYNFFVENKVQRHSDKRH
ncbi:O-antigen ligase family protein [Candidatus Saccharibacteria bacterium]|nr:O-antigen ligase family protein [Candidatus Saccharibacteria bacterium]